MKSMSLRSVLLFGTAAVALGGYAGLPAQAAALRVGSGNEAVIEPPVSHPDETPCSVPLIAGAQFNSYNSTPYTFTPPASCPGPWAKVVLSINLSLNEGRQFDRTGELFLDGVPLWFGTTAEPRATLAPHWHFERDVTDYTALFNTTQSGSVSIGNTVNSTYTSTITATATLLFYPVTSTAPAPVTADVVLPIPGSGGSGSLNNGTDTIATSMVFPTNVLSAKMDIYLQGQGGDEFWYSCVPNSLAGVLEDCGGGALREGEIAIDSMPAGVAPVYPWIFTGGIDPYLWQPIPGVQTFDFTPFQVDLSPFAGVLSNGVAHTIAASVYGDNGSFTATGAIRLFLDHGASTVSGTVTRNTLLASPTVQETNTITTTGGVSSGTVDTSDTRDFTIEGNVTGSAGTTTNKVRQTTDFSNDQSFIVSATQYKQKIHQHTNVTVTSSSKTGGVQTQTTTTLQWPLTFFYNYLVGANGTSKQIASIDQQYISGIAQSIGGVPASQDNLTDAIQTADTLFFSDAGSVTGHKSQSETATYLRNGTSTSCFQRTLQATSNVLSLVQTGC